MELNAITKLTILRSLELSVERAEERLKECQQHCPELARFWENEIASYKEAHEKILGA